METTNEIVKLFRERLKYPIITVYCIVLIVYNWDVLGIFFLSNKGIEERIIYINTVFKGQSWSRVLWPLAKALFLSIFAPFLMLGLDLALKQINTRRQKIRDEKLLQTLNKKLEVANLEFQIEEAKNGKKTVEELNNKIVKLNADAQEIKQSFEDSKNDIENLSRTIQFSDELMSGVTKSIIDKIKVYLSEKDFIKFLQFITDNRNNKVTYSMLNLHFGTKYLKEHNSTFPEDTFNNLINIFLSNYIIENLNNNEFIIGSIGKVIVHDLIHKNVLHYDDQNHG